MACRTATPSPAPPGCPPLFLLLSEFDVDAGSTLRGVVPPLPPRSVAVVADLMLPEGAHARPHDFTVFSLPLEGGGALSLLLSMGFGRDAARAALRDCSGDARAATEQPLLSR